MIARGFLLLLLLPLLLAAKADPYEHVSAADRTQLQAGLERYVRDQIARDWSDLFEIAIPGYAVRGDYDDPTGKREPFLTKDRFVEAMEGGVSNGSRPFMRSFDLVSITPNEGGYEVRGCSKAQRESFHFKGILRFNAYVAQGKIRFGGWTYVDSMPHSCRQTTNND